MTTEEIANAWSDISKVLNENESRLSLPDLIGILHSNHYEDSIRTTFWLMIGDGVIDVDKNFEASLILMIGDGVIDVDKNFEASLI